MNVRCRHAVLPLALALCLAAGCTEKKVKEMTVPVAKANIPSGSKIAPGDVEMIKLTELEFLQKGWPIREVMLRDQDVKDRICRDEIKQGEAFLTSNLFAVNDAQFTMVWELAALRPTESEKIRGLLDQVATMARSDRENGCISFDLYQSRVPPPQPGKTAISPMLIVVQRWRQQKDFEEFAKSDTFKKYFLGQVIQNVRMYMNGPVQVIATGLETKDEKKGATDNAPALPLPPGALPNETKPTAEKPFQG